ncbi:MAG: ribosome-associated translation inhibitor RaiA [Ignavibacteriaceae bacterium]|nr:ribosome-associated translation inhibitor RaiA [Ignavibacteriaceae bacterium]
MNISITARKFKAHSTLKDFVTAEVESLAKYDDSILDVNVVLSFQNSSNSVKTAEIIVKVPGQVLTAAESTDDFNKSVVAAVEKLSRQLQKFKTKKIQYGIKNED